MKSPSVTIYVALLLLTAWTSMHGATTTTGIQSVDSANSTVTLYEKGESKLYHMTMVAAVYLDGAEATLKQLSPGMKVISLSLSDPSTISELRVTSATLHVPIAPTGESPALQKHSQFAEPPMAPAELAALTTKLADSYWAHPATPGSNVVAPNSDWIYLSANGRLVDTTHKKAQGTWSLADRHTLIIKDSAAQFSGKKPPERFPLNPDFTAAGAWIRVAQPQQAMQDKVASALKR